MDLYTQRQKALQDQQGLAEVVDLAARPDLVARRRDRQVLQQDQQELLRDPRKLGRPVLRVCPDLVDLVDLLEPQDLQELLIQADLAVLQEQLERRVKAAQPVRQGLLERLGLRGRKKNAASQED